MTRIICVGGIEAIPWRLTFLAGGKKRHLHEPCSFPALQSVMLIIQVFVALLLCVSDLGIPATLLHNLLGSENGVFVVIVTVDAVRVFDQLAVFDVPPAISITDAGDVPGGVVDCTGYELAEFYGFWHEGLLSNAKKATCRGDRSPRMVGKRIAWLRCV